MPPDCARSLNAQGRQKSCAKCAKSKRKCDLQQPRCRRCTRQRLTCTYPPQPHSQAAVIIPNDPMEDPLTDDLFGDPGLELSFNLDVPSVPVAADIDLFDTAHDLLVPMSSLEDPNIALQRLRSSDLIESPSRSGPPSAKAFSDFVISETFESRVGYSLEQWKLAPKMMVQKACTPWSHPSLYEEEMPRSIQDAFAACSLYVSRTEDNSKYVLRYITDRAYELVEQPMPVIPAEVVARAHAILLYQVMLTTSSDYRYFSQTRRLTPHLKDLSDSLKNMVDEDRSQSRDSEHFEAIPLYPSSIARAAWKSFIFRESCRRTHLVVCHSISICVLLQGEVLDCNHSMATGNRVTISSALWEANSPLDFAIAWNEKNHYLVKNLDFTDVLSSAKACDVDVFGRMIMVGLMGVDDVKGWLHSKGGTL